ncbi:MAG TPA: hypothetical protein VKB93_05900 [Thermoanaerobaculia bacterium]|nr:hypothetical protein [Thermoanaerobaculia bacterium]
MPKFKDLGINAIPMTMQPPEIGEGGGYRVDTQCPDEGTCGDTCVCSDDKEDIAYVATQCPDEGTCGDTCVEYDDDTLKTSGTFAPEAIAQLRQQLEERIDR